MKHGGGGGLGRSAILCKEAEKWHGMPREGTTEMRSLLRAAVMMGRGEDDMS
jgi:hypothetical protein